MISYDQRKGWRGAIKNKNFNKNWYQGLEKYELEKSLNWDLAILKKINQFSAVIENKDKIEGLIEYKEISWTKKEFNDLFKNGDIIYVKAGSANPTCPWPHLWSLVSDGRTLRGSGLAKSPRINPLPLACQG